MELGDQSLVLIGYRATGKTTVARLLAERLGFDWIDADDEIEHRAGKSITAIFAEDGEDAFRDLEAEVIDELCRWRGTVIALGGGAVLREQNRTTIRLAGKVIWLRASANTLADRLAGDHTTASRRPNLTPSGGLSEIESLLATREPIYRACAAFEVDTEGKTPAQVVDEIVARLGNGE